MSLLTKTSVVPPFFSCAFFVLEDGNVVESYFSSYFLSQEESPSRLEAREKAVDEDVTPEGRE